MIFRDTSKKTVDLNKDTRFFLQNGTFAIGLSGESGNFPVNVSNSTARVPLELTDDAISRSCEPNWLGGATNVTEYDIEEIYPDEKLIIVPYKFLTKLKPGDPVQLVRKEIRNNYVVKKISIIYDPLAGFSAWHGTYVYLMNDRNYQTDSFDTLNSYIGITGFPLPSADSHLRIIRKTEISDIYRETLQDFYLDFNDYEYSDSYSIKVNWVIDPTVKATKLRWRSIPRNQQVTSDILLTLNSGGLYSGTGPTAPSAEVVSDTGRSAKIELACTWGATSGTVSGVSLVQIGGGFLSSPIITVDSTNEIVPASITADLVLDTEGRIDYISVVNGGTGYTGANVTVSPIPSIVNGATAEGYAEIEDGIIKNIVLTNSGYGFTEYGYTGSITAVVTPTGTGGAGAILRPNIDMSSEWTYENPVFLEKEKIIHGLKFGLPYEIQILTSDDENFIGFNSYSNSIEFIY